jgi:DNA-binding winged helix-turn-helix (wHTH) protein
MGDNDTSVFAFHAFCLDPAKRLLRSGDGQIVSLTPKEFDTLLVLVEALGSVVNKDELIARVWPDSYVGEGSLARNISVLRKALGTEVIETLPKKGYRISVPVSRAEVTCDLPGVNLTVESNEQPSPPESRRAMEPATRWWARRSRVWLAMASVVLILVVFRFGSIMSAKMTSAAASVAPIRSILIQKEGALDPLDEGFKLARPQGPYPQAIFNRETNGWDRWRIVSDDQNYYYRILTAAEKDFALHRDWRLTCVCAVESGAGEADIDLAGKGARFDMEFLQEGDRYFVALVNQLSPDLKWDQKIEFAGVGDVAHPHTYELRYDHVTQTASLWIDGQQTASGYRGYHQFQDDSKPSLTFGTFIYGYAPNGSFVSRRVRFEVN